MCVSCSDAARRSHLLFPHHVFTAQIQISNITEDTSSLWVTHVHTEAQLRNEMEILNTITEDLRLKDWEHSLALKNITILEGQIQ